jgi:hypothetical protein
MSVLVRGVVLGWLVSAMAVAQSVPQSVPKSTSLAVNGHDGDAPVIQSNGRSYVDVEALTRITNGSLQFQGNKIILTLPPSVSIQPMRPAPPAAASPAANTPAKETGFSAEFLRDGIEAMSVIREWRAAIENAVRTNNPVDDSWVSGFRRSAENRVSLAQTAATTDSDRQGITLLQNQLGMMRQLSDRLLDMRRSVTFVPTNLLDNDPLDQKILACAQGMAAQAVPGAQFVDVPACH